MDNLEAGQERVEDGQERLEAFMRSVDNLDHMLELVAGSTYETRALNRAPGMLRRVMGI